MSTKLRQIAVDENNYLALKQLGSAGDSFNDVITEVLKKIKAPLQIDSRVGSSRDQSTTVVVGSKAAAHSHSTMEDDIEYG